MFFRYTILYVRDVKATLDFYASAFGQEQGFLHESGHFGELRTGETKLSLLHRVDGAVGQDRCDKPRRPARL